MRQLRTWPPKEQLQNHGEDKRQSANGTTSEQAECLLSWKAWRSKKRCYDTKSSSQKHGKAAKKCCIMWKLKTFLWQNSSTQQKSKNIPQLSMCDPHIIGIVRTGVRVSPLRALRVCGCVSGKTIKQFQPLSNRDYTSIRTMSLFCLWGDRGKGRKPRCEREWTFYRLRDILPARANTC